MRILIATLKTPTADGFRGFCDALRLAAEQHGFDIPQGIIYTGGKNGCANLAFELNGNSEDDQSEFANEVTFAMQPARWTTTTDELPAEDTFAL